MAIPCDLVRSGAIWCDLVRSGSISLGMLKIFFASAAGEPLPLRSVTHIVDIVPAHSRVDVLALEQQGKLSPGVRIGVEGLEQCFSRYVGSWDTFVGK